LDIFVNVTSYVNLFNRVLKPNHIFITVVRKLCACMTLKTKPFKFKLVTYQLNDYILNGSNYTEHVDKCTIVDIRWHWSKKVWFWLVIKVSIKMSRLSEKNNFVEYRKQSIIFNYITLSFGSSFVQLFRELVLNDFPFSSSSGHDLTDFY